MKKEESFLIEPSKNAHTLVGKGIKVTEIEPSVLLINTNGNSIVTHGEHGTLAVESECIAKYVQQELNPITKAMQNAFD